jgi:hypothetical protein
VIEFLDPKAEPAAQARAYALGLGDELHTRPVRVGLLANGFADSVAFLCEVRDALAARLPLATFVSAAKLNPSVLVGDDLHDEIAANCDALVTAYGH